MAFVNNQLVSGLPFGGKKREITKEEEIKLRIRIDEEVEDLKRNEIIKIVQSVKKE